MKGAGKLFSLSHARVGLHTDLAPDCTSKVHSQPSCAPVSTAREGSAGEVELHATSIVTFTKSQSRCASPGREKKRRRPTAPEGSGDAVGGKRRHMAIVSQHASGAGAGSPRPPTSVKKSMTEPLIGVFVSESTHGLLRSPHSDACTMEPPDSTPRIVAPRNSPRSNAAPGSEKLQGDVSCAVAAGSARASRVAARTA